MPPPTVRSRLPEADQLRFLARVARMYHEQGLSQPQIAARLHISQPRVSRLLRQAADVGIVRTVVTTPPGVFTDLEEQLESRYGLLDAVVVEASGSGGDVLPALGAAAAQYLDVIMTGGDVIGVSSWSETLIRTVDAMRVKTGQVADKVVQLLGGVGDPDAQAQATRLTSRLADLTGATPLFVPAPGLVSSTAVRRALMRDTSVGTVAATWGEVTLALVGVGSLAPSPLLRRSGNAVAEADQEQLRQLGAVGDVCYRFFGADGRHVRSGLDQRVVGIGHQDLRRIPRRIGVAGGERKSTAIRAALIGDWLNVLITDRTVAEQLLETRP